MGHYDVTNRTCVPFACNLQSCSQFEPWSINLFTVSKLRLPRSEETITDLPSSVTLHPPCAGNGLSKMGVTIARPALTWHEFENKVEKIYS